MPDGAIVFPLALLTLVVFALWGGWQLIRVQQAKKNNEHSALSDPPADAPIHPRGKP